MTDTRDIIIRKAVLTKKAAVVLRYAAFYLQVNSVVLTVDKERLSVECGG